LFHPTFALVFVEGASKFVNNYKRLMLKRIVWTEAARPRGVEDVEIDAGEDGAARASTKPVPAAEGAAEEEAPPSLEDNRCDLVWEGQLRERTFGNFKPKACPTDHLAKETLGTKLAGYWDAAKNFKPAEDELF
jgi:U4/U6 small nuclear ribonucleoprotein PRP3